MDHILEELCVLAPGLLNNLGFRVVEQSDIEENMNSYVVLEKGNIRVRFVRDRGKVFGEIRSKAPGGSWQLFSCVAQLIGLEARAVDLDVNESGVLSRIVAFLRENWDTLDESFSVDRLPDTEQRLNALAEQRIRKLLPPEFFRRVDAARKAKEPGMKEENGVREE